MRDYGISIRTHNSHSQVLRESTRGLCRNSRMTRKRGKTLGKAQYEARPFGADKFKLDDATRHDTTNNKGKIVGIPSTGSEGKTHVSEDLGLNLVESFSTTELSCDLPIWVPRCHLALQQGHGQFSRTPCSPLPQGRSVCCAQGPHSDLSRQSTILRGPTLL